MLLEAGFHESLPPISPPVKKSGPRVWLLLAAKVTDRLWGIGDVVDVIEAREASRRQKAA
jgi:hypothetical protein